MLPVDGFYECLTAQGMNFFTGVPDSLLKDFCAYVTDTAPKEQHIITANEGLAVGLAAGHYLATGEVPVVYMQNSGFGNTINALTSLTDPEVYGIPMLMVVGWRGEPGKKKDAPQHVKMGKVMLDMIEVLGIPYEVVPDDLELAADAVARASAWMLAEQSPYVLVISAGTFGKYSLQSERPQVYDMSREEAIQHVVGALPDNALLVSTTGKPSRELFEVREQRGEGHDNDFLTVGCMGHSAKIALGVALAKPNRSVVCVDGDGAALMHLGAMSTIGTMGPKNYHHVLINNAAHDSVGGQPTVGFEVDFGQIATANGYRSVHRADDAQTLSEVLPQFFAAEGPSILEIRVKTGARKDLGRPTMGPRELKHAFMSACEED